MALFIPLKHIAFPAIIFAYIQIAAFFAFPIFSLLAWSRLGWHSVHYGGCLATAVMFGIFLLINYDEVFKEKAARESTFNALFTYERCRSRIITLRLPYLSIYQDIRVWSTFIAAFGYFTALNLYLTFGATFLNKVVSLPIVSTGLLLAIPPASNTVISFVTYGLFSKLANTEINKMRFFNSLGTVPSGVLFAMIGLFNPELQPASVTVLYAVLLLITSDSNP
ncbi:hypothetical protein COOONC_15236 [Cooperia oncophora]